MDNKTVSITRGIVALVTIVNLALMAFDMNPINLDEGMVSEAVSAVAVVVASIWIWWKNNSVTDEGVAGDAVTHKLKNQKLSKHEADAYMAAKKKMS